MSHKKKLIAYKMSTTERAFCKKCSTARPCSAFVKPNGRVMKTCDRHWTKEALEKAKKYNAESRQRQKEKFPSSVECVKTEETPKVKSYAKPKVAPKKKEEPKEEPKEVPTQVCTRKTCSFKGEPQPLDQFRSANGKTIVKTCLTCREEDTAKREKRYKELDKIMEERAKQPRKGASKIFLPSKK